MRSAHGGGRDKKLRDSKEHLLQKNTCYSVVGVVVGTRSVGVTSNDANG